MNFPIIANALNTLLGSVEGPLTVYKNAKEVQSLFSNKGSILRLLKDYLIEPTIFVTRSVREQCPDKEHDAIGEQIDLFCSFYSQAFKILVNVHKVDAKIAVSLLGTSGYDYNVGNALERIALKNVGGVESAEMRLCDFNSRPFLSFNSGLEATKDALDITKLTPDDIRDINKKYTYNKEILSKKIVAEENKLNYKINSDTNEARAKQGIKLDTGMKDIKDQAHYGYQIRNFLISMVVGNDQGKSVVIEIPITIKANIVFLRVEELVNALMPKHSDKGFFARWDRWRSGGISFWKDLILCSDLIQEAKKGKLKDKNDIMGKISAAEIGGVSKLATAGDIGYERFYNMYTMTSSDAEVIEKYLKGKLSNPKFKEDFLRKANGLQLFVLDPDWEIGQLYLKDIATPSSIKFANIGRRKKNDGSLNELFKALYSNNAPVF